MPTIRRVKPVAEFHHLELHPASYKDAAGVVSHTTYTNHAPGQGGGPSVVQEVEVRHHKNKEDLHAHIDQHTSHMFGEDADRDIADGELRRPGHNEKAAGGDHD